MLFYAHEIVKFFGGLYPSLIIIVTILCAVVYLSWNLMGWLAWWRRSWLRLGFLLPFLSAVIMQRYGWREGAQMRDLLKKQDAITEEQLAVFVQDSVEKSTWLIATGVICSIALWGVVSWHTKRRIRQTNSAHPATRE